MFDFLKRNKEYVSCEWLEYGIHFNLSGLYHCCMYAHSNANDFPVSRLDFEMKYNFKDFLEKKNKSRKNFRKGIIEDRCKGCFELKKKNWLKQFKIKNMAISTNTSCNSNCIYCYTHNKKKYFNKIPDIPIYDFIKENIKKKIITSDCNIQFGGGEPVLNHEFEKILNLFIDKCFNNIRIHSSGIKYSLAIERSLQNDACNLVISPDSGTKELYYKIKCVDKFDDVWSNIRKYAQAQNKKKDMLHLKYIIIPNVNDRVQDIKDFIDKTKESGVNHVLIDLEMEWYKNNRTDKEKITKIFELVKYFESYARKSGLTHSHNPTICTAINEGYHELYDSIVVDI